MDGWVGGWCSTYVKELVLEDDDRVGVTNRSLHQALGVFGRPGGENLCLEWVGGWVDRGERGGLNELLDSMGGWVG